jgi:hypothetical protein
MDRTFAEHVDSIEPAVQQLMAMPPVRVTALPRSMPETGVYLFSEGTSHLYVGRTDRLRKRLQEHGRPGSPESCAPFAFRIAREVTRRPVASYAPEGSRRSLAGDPVFGPAFVQAKARVRKMDIRWVEETDELRQALLEIYVAVVLQAPYNDFRNH